MASVEGAETVVEVEVGVVVVVEDVGSNQCSRCVASAEGAVDHYPTDLLTSNSGTSTILQRFSFWCLDSLEALLPRSMVPPFPLRSS